jgi:hypothetical protein
MVLDSRDPQNSNVDRQQPNLTTATRGAQMPESDEPSEFDKSFISSVGSSKDLGIIDQDVLGILSRLPIKFKERLAGLGVRIVCCRTLRDA